MVLSAQHESGVSLAEIRAGLQRHVIDAVLPGCLEQGACRVHLNPTGRFVQGGPTADAGLTGRKIIVDTYGGAVPHGGGAFSGKDPTKVDRSAAYMARHVARSLVASRLARRALVQLAYAIGLAPPVSVMVNTFGTGTQPDEDLARLVESTFPLTPSGIIEELDLRRPIYEQTAAYGHFGRSELDLPWESERRMDEGVEEDHV